MVEQNYNMLLQKAKADIELLLINDCNERIEISDGLNRMCQVKLLQNEENKGIHYSRVKGLKEARGKYVLFLDQDDEIVPQYLLSQEECISDYDIVICNGLNNGRLIYPSDKMLKAVCGVDNYMGGINRIVSPGQALIKRDAIPDMWINTILESNGADDYFLWLLMLLENKKFVTNREILYKHNYTGDNTSDDLQSMEDSVTEVVEILFSKKRINRERFEQLKKGPAFAYKDTAKLMRLYQRSNRIQAILDCWLTNKEKNLTCKQYLEDKGIKDVVVYGCGVLGRHLINELWGTEVNIEAVIDRDLSKGGDGIKTIRLGDEVSANALIIITPVLEAKEIEKELHRYYSNEIMYINQLIENMQ